MEQLSTLNDSPIRTLLDSQAAPRPHMAPIPQLSEHGYAAPDYLQATAALVAPFKQRSYAQMRLQAGQRVLDVGCGVGIDVIQLAKHVGASGSVHGVDADADMLQVAQQQLVALGLAHATLQMASADALPWSDSSFDAVRSERMLQHLSQPELAIAEMLRVTRAGGRVVLLDTDWGSLSIHMENAALERRLAGFKAQLALRNGFSGRRLYALLQQARLTDISIEVLPLYSTDYQVARFACALDDLSQRALMAGVISQQEMEEFNHCMLAANSEHSFFASVNMLLVAGTKA